MGEFWGKLINYVIIILFITICPLLLFLQKSDDIVQGYVDNIGQEFLDTCRKTGYVSEDAYYDLITSLSNTNYSYSIELKHYADKAYPITDNNGIPNGNYLQTKVSTEDNMIEECISSYIVKSESGAEYEKIGTAFKMKQGDFLSVEITLRGTTLANRLFALMTGSVSESGAIRGIYSGYVGTTAKTE